MSNRARIVGIGGLLLVVAIYVVWTRVRLGGETVTVAFEDYGQAAAALIGSIACAVAARRSAGRMRLGWSLLALYALSWSAGEVFWSINEVNLGASVPFPSPADAGFVGAIPFAAAALLAFPFGPSTTMGRVRAVMDGLIVATSLTFVAWALGLGSLEAQTRVGVIGALLAVAYPAGDLLLLTLVVGSAPRVSPATRQLLIILLVVFAANLVADLSFAYLTLQAQYRILGSAYDTGWVAGFLALAVAATWPADTAVRTRADDSVELWQLGMPWIGVFGVIGASVWVAITGRQTGVVATWLGTGMGVIFLASQGLTLNDALRLLVRSRKAEAQLQSQTRLLDEVIASAPIGVERVGFNLRILDANPAVCAMLRAPAKAVVGSSVRDYLSPDEMEKVMTKFMPLRDGTADQVEADSEVRRADGSTCWVHWLVTAVRRPDGKIDYFLAILEDVTAKHELEEAQRANMGELERINRLKSEFMSMVSHEFRTALTGIQGYSEVMTTEEVAPDEVKQFAGDINSEALRLNRMITEMLDLDRIESGRIELHLEPVDLNKLVSGIAERARMVSSRHEIVLSLGHVLPAIEGDGDRLTQVVTNLLSNAVKYSPEGGEVLVATCVVDGNVEVSVRDHGPGIPPEFIKKIFGRYERYEGAGKAQVVGTGLGLAISQQIIQLHKGRIWVESTVGEGSTFRFTIPVPGRGARLESGDGDLHASGSRTVPLT
jgi:two-component system, sensor histidine kinase and response regulator